MTRKHKALMASAARATINREGHSMTDEQITKRAIKTYREAYTAAINRAETAEAENEILKSRLAKAVSKLDDLLDLDMEEAAQMAIRDLILDLVRQKDTP